ncbi:MAG: 4-hydroxy-tetrahydrodipicolinate reductase [bacterium]
MIRICLVGGLGRMGREIAHEVLESNDIIISSVVERVDRLANIKDYEDLTGYAKSSVVLTSDVIVGIDKCDVVVDFSTPESFEKLVQVLDLQRKPLVTGTTGIQGKREKLKSIAEKVCVVDAPNMAVGVNLVFKVVDTIARILKEGYDIEIIEAHHRMKKDSPSGTALGIAEIVKRLQGRKITIGRPAGSSERGSEVVIHSLRIDGVAGEHKIIFAGEDEMIELKHIARTRRAFAKGAIEGVRFASKAAPGLYDMIDVLGLGR